MTDNLALPTPDVATAQSEALEGAGAVSLHAADLSLWSMVAEASVVVQLVMLLLVVASVVSWALIVDKHLLLRKVLSGVEESAGLVDAMPLEQAMAHLADREDPLARGLKAAWAERMSPRLKHLALPQVHAALLATAEHQAERRWWQLGERIGFLATVGSTAPFIGLFGTVWGIMDAFQAIAITKNTSLAVVAPGIAEALLATAIGLFAAIPAVIFYNRFTGMIGRMAEYTSLVMETALHQVGAAPVRPKEAPAPATPEQRLL